MPRSALSRRTFVAGDVAAGMLIAGAGSGLAAAAPPYVATDSYSPGAGDPATMLHPLGHGLTF